MNRVLGYTIALIVLGGIAVAIYTYAPKAPALSSATSTETQNNGTDMKVEAVYAETDEYRVEAHYPQFGISVVDEKIKAVVDTAIADFKAYPANPADSSVPQNEFTGSFNSTYIGTDIASVALSFSEYTGGAHPNTALVSVNVDRTTGKEITLDDALTMIGKDLQEVAEASLKELKVTLGRDIIAPEGADPKAENYSVFLVSKDKVTFIFNTYQVGPYSSGHQEVWFKRVK